MRGLGKIPTSFSMDVVIQDEKDDLPEEHARFLAGRMTASKRSLVRMRLSRMRTAAMVMMSLRRTSRPVVSQSKATTSLGGPGWNMKRNAGSLMVA